MTPPTLMVSRDFLIFLAIVGLVLIVFYRYVYSQERRQARRLTGAQTFWLWALRLTVALLALLALAKVSTVKVLTEIRTPVVALLLDESASMGFPTSRGDVFAAGNVKEDRTRHKAAQAMIQRLQEKLTETHRVMLYVFSDTLKLHQELPCRKGTEDPPRQVVDIFKPTRKADGQYSNVGDGLKDVLRQLTSEKVAGVVMLSDFQQTGGTALEAARDIAVNAKPTIPVHTLPKGTQYPLRDLRIDEVRVVPEANLGDVLTFHVKITNNVEDQLAPRMTLYEEDDEVTKKKPLLKRGSENMVPISTIPETEGIRKFRIELEPQDDEVNLENNVAVVHVEIVKRTLRVIMVAGRPSREYFYIVPALLRDPIIKLSCYLQSADVDYVHQGNSNIDRLPKTLKEWQSFDVAILQDVDPNGITNQQVAGLENMVNKGGGLVVIAGRNNGLAKLVQVHAVRVRSLLPVEVDKNLYPDYDRRFEKPFKARRTPQGKGHPIMFASTDMVFNEKLWKTFPQFYWHHQVPGKQPQAITLLERDSAGDQGGAVLMAIQRYGEGAVFFSAVDSMWRWRYPYESFDYDRFWTRVVRYLGETRLHGSQQQVALETDHRAYSPGERVKISLRVLDPALMAQLAGQQVFATVVSHKGDEHNVELRPRTDRTPVYDGYYRARNVGSMIVKCQQQAPEADSEQKLLFDAKHNFQVKMQSLEDKDTSADLKAAEDLARKTGGQYLDYSMIRDRRDLDKITQVVPPDPKVLKHSRVVDAWDGAKFLLLFLVLISAEWCLRKLWGLL